MSFECIEIWSYIIAVAMGAEHGALCTHVERGKEEEECVCSAQIWYGLAWALAGSRYNVSSSKYTVVNHIYSSEDIKVYI